jgi:hypothetical protein
MANLAGAVLMTTTIKRVCDTLLDKTSRKTQTNTQYKLELFGYCLKLATKYRE